MAGKLTVVIGASENPERYSNMAVIKLLKYAHPVQAIGLKAGIINTTTIQTQLIVFDNVDTVTLYVGPQNQSNYASYIIALNPKRVIFNPGTENPELQAHLQAAGINFIEACTLVMLSSGLY
jgi:uncharacterized protein